MHSRPKLAQLIRAEDEVCSATSAETAKLAACAVLKPLLSFAGMTMMSPSRYCATIAAALAHAWYFVLQRWRRRRDDNRRQTLQQQTLFSHKANPMYDTTQTMTTTSSSARGDDFEVIRVPPSQPPPQSLSTRDTMYPDPMTYMPPVFTVCHRFLSSAEDKASLMRSPQPCSCEMQSSKCIVQYHHDNAWPLSASASASAVSAGLGQNLSCSVPTLLR